MRNIGKRLLGLCLALVLVLGVLPLAPAEAATTKEKISALEQEAKEIAQHKKELQQEIATLKSNKSEALSKKNKLDDRNELIRSEIQNTETRIAEYDTLLLETQAELAETKKKEARQYEIFCQRVRSMEENGKVDYWTVLFQATSFTDMLSRLADIQEVMEYDQGVMNHLADLRVEIEEKEKSLSEQLTAAETAKSSLVEQRKELQEQVDEAAAMLAEIEKDQAGLQKLYNDEIAAAKEIDAQIKALEKQLASSNQTKKATYGGYIWPVDSHYITSPFGTRNHPIYKTKMTHYGIDVGRVGYTSSVYAVKSGTVITSQYSSSYGNYIVVSHGSGNTSLYAHLSSRKVSVGATVKQGQVIGITGTTGNSTGPHLHFELREDSARINPLKYLTDYTKGW